MKQFYFVLLFSLFICFTQSTLGPNDKKVKKKKEENTKPLKFEQLDEQVDVNFSKEDQYLKLKKKNLETNDIIKHHGDFCKTCNKTFQNDVLGYVTPWNSKGYDMSKAFPNKVNLISPVWLQIKRTGRKKYQLTGTHDIDNKWMKEVRKNAGDKLVKLLPRVLFENFKPEDLHALFNDEEEIQSLAKTLVEKSNEFIFDGYVLEIYSQFGFNGKNEINHIITDVASELHKINKILVLVIPPAVKNIEENGKIIVKTEAFNDQDFYNLKDIVDFFSLMTYDFWSINGMIGPNAPTQWIYENVKYLTDSSKYRPKILLGLNFYGMKYVVDETGKLKGQPEPIVGNQLIDLIKKKKAIIKYDEPSEEHAFLFKSNKDQIIVFYPTLHSIQARINLANELGTGLSIWELGQGMNYFFDLL